MHVRLPHRSLLGNMIIMAVYGRHLIILTHDNMYDVVRLRVCVYMYVYSTACANTETQRMS